MTPVAFDITSKGNKQSALWVGNKNSLEVTKVTQFDGEKLFFTTSVVLKNTGTSALTNVYYMRTVDPDQEQPFTGNYGTNNYVMYQRFMETGDGPYVNGADGMANECFVAAEGQTYSDLYCGLGTINSHCRVNHWGFNNDNAITSWNNDVWRSYSESSMKNADEAIQLMFKYDSIPAGGTEQFNYAYVLGPDDLVEAMQDLSYVTITNPTDIVSGGNALFKSLIDAGALTGGKTITSVEYVASERAVRTPAGAPWDPSNSPT